MIATVIAIIALVALTTWSFNNALEASQQRDAAKQAESTAEVARLAANFLAQTAQANAQEALEQRSLADAASTAAIEQQETALAERNSALEAQETAQAASTLAIEQQETAEAERLNADDARAALAENLEQLLATLEATPTTTPTPAPTEARQQAAAAQTTNTPTIVAPTPTTDRGATATVLAVQAQLAAVQATQNRCRPGTEDGQSATWKFPDGNLSVTQEVCPASTATRNRKKMNSRNEPSSCPHTGLTGLR